MTQILDKVNEPQDLKGLSMEELDTLSAEIRALLIKKINATGGHFGPNLGFIEPTVALHYVFNTPQDKFVFDVSHQCYTHKILTGRKQYFTNPAKYHEISGYTNPQESAHDTFVIGHTSTAPSLAVGLAKARDLQGKTGNVIAIIGDGSLSGGEALEGLDAAAELNSNLIILVNDNEMCIAPDHGGLYKNLALLRQTRGQAECNFFKALGLDYKYVENGNDVRSLIAAFQQVKDVSRPTVVHIHTLKGIGCPQAEANKEAFHWVMPGVLDEKKNPAPAAETYASLTQRHLIEKRKQDPSVIVISPATPGAYGLTPDVRAQLGAGYTDVGIAEEHAVAYASGLAAGGAKPVLQVLSSFVQRTYDQLSQDLALNKNPATLLIHWGGISAGDATHLGIFDIPLISNIPNMVYLAPTGRAEYLAMLDWAMAQKQYPVAIRVPFTDVAETGLPVDKDYAVLNKYQVAEQGREIAVLGLGNFFSLGKSVCGEIHRTLGITPTLINPRYMTGLDKPLLEELKKTHRLVITLEDGVLDGGFGEKVAAFYGNSTMKVLTYGAHKEFTDRVPLEELYRRFRLTKEQIAQDVHDYLK